MEGQGVRDHRSGSDVDGPRRRRRGALRDFARDFALDFVLESVAWLATVALLLGCAACVWLLWRVHPALGVAGAVVILAGLSGIVAKVLFTGPWSARRFLKGLATVVVYAAVAVLG